MGIPAATSNSHIADDNIADNHNNTTTTETAIPETKTATTHVVTSVLGGIGMNHTTWRPPAHQAAAKTIFLARHAEAEHNVEPPNYSLSDPRLTVVGVRQAQQQLRNHLPADARANLPLVVCSPMRRALQTVQYAFGRQIEWHGIRLVVHPDLQEISGGDHHHPCDQGSSRDQLMEWFPTLDQEIQQHLPDGWELTGKSSLLQGSEERKDQAIHDRIQRFKEWLLQRPESVILVMTHNGLLRHMLGVDLWSQHGHSPRGFENSEVRRYTLGWEEVDVEEVEVTDQELSVQHEGHGVKGAAVQSTARRQLPGPFEQATTHVLTLNAVDHEVKSVGYLD